MIINQECLSALTALEPCIFDALITDPPAGISFMNKEWDKPTDFIKDMTAIYKECLRVLKPGAHGLVWAIPRTSHWTATALEQAGFEIRDVITHIFGSGFPKSLNIGKTLSEWEGWGTALKPASEHWILVRKPLAEKTVAQNVLKHGTGALNIDASRIGNETIQISKGKGFANKNIYEGGVNDTTTKTTHQGRFPANFVLSHNEDCEDKCTEGCAVKMLDEQSGKSKGGNRKQQVKSFRGNGVGENIVVGMTSSPVDYQDIGGASRFFYCAKASTKDRGSDNFHPTVKSTKLMEYLIKLITPPKGTVLDPFMGSGSTGVAAKRLGFKFVGIDKEEEYFEIAEKRIG